ADQPLHRRHAYSQILRHRHHRRPGHAPGRHRRRPGPGPDRSPGRPVCRTDLHRRGQLRRPGAGAHRAPQRPARENRMKALRIPLGLAVLAALALLPLYGSDTFIQFGISTLLLAVLAQGWNIIGGYAGYPSFGNSAFYGLGAYGVAIAMVQWQLPF